MRKIGNLLIALSLVGCVGNGKIQKSNPSYTVLNVNYYLRQTDILFFKAEYEWQVEIPYNCVNFVYLQNRLQREQIPTEYTYSSENDYYGCNNIFHYYGNSVTFIYW